MNRDRVDKPYLPGRITMAANLARAVAAHVADGRQKADAPALQRRLETCSVCELRNDDRCTVCGRLLCCRHQSLRQPRPENPMFFLQIRNLTSLILASHRRQQSKNRMQNRVHHATVARG